MGLKMELKILPSLAQYGLPEEYYHRRKPFEVEVADHTVKYVLCPQTKLDKWAGSTKLGFTERAPDGKQMIFVNKNLSPTQVPFVALELYLRGMSQDELERSIGLESESLSEVTYQKLEELKLATALIAAARLLEPKELTGLMDLYRDERLGYVGSDDSLLVKVAEAYERSLDLPALPGRVRKSFTYRTERMAEYLDAHHYHKHSRKSRGIAGLKGEARRWLESDMVASEPAVRAIKEDSVLMEALPGLIEICRQLQEMKKGEQFVIDPKGAAFLYRCEENLPKGRRKPVELKEYLDDGREIYQVNSFGMLYFRGLLPRLERLALEEERLVRKALENLEDIVVKIGRGEEDFREVLQEASGLVAIHAGIKPTTEEKSGTAIIPYLGAREMKGELEQVGENLALAYARVTEETAHLVTAQRARRLLERLGMDTAELDAKIIELRKPGLRVVQETAGVRKLAANGEDY